MNTEILRNQNVVLLNNNRPWLNDMSARLKTFGATNVILETNPIQLQAHLRKTGVHLILSSLNTHKRSGIAVLQELRRDLCFSHIPFILCVDQFDEEDIRLAIDCGVNRIVIESITTHNLYNELSIFFNSQRSEDIALANSVGNLIEKGEVAFAQSILDTLATGYANDSLILLLMGNCAFAEGDFEKAKRHYLNALATSNDAYTILEKLVHTALTGGKKKEAIAYLKRMHADSKDDMLVLHRLASLSYEQGDFSESVSLFKCLVNLDPNNEGFKARLSEVLYMNGDKQQAMMLVQSKPLEFLSFLDRLTLERVEKLDFFGATQVVMDALRVTEEDHQRSKLLYNLANFFCRCDLKKDAIIVLNIVRIDYPNYSEAIEFLHRIFEEQTESAEFDKWCDCIEKVSLKRYLQSDD